MVDIIPMRFYGFDTMIYLIGAIICLLIAYKATKLHALSGKRQHFYLAAAFTVLGIGLATVTLTTAYTYYNMLYLGQTIYFFDQFFNVDDVGFWIYYLSAFLAYGLLVLMYMPNLGKSGAFAPLVFFSTRYFEYFNIVLFFMIAYVAFRASSHYFMKKSRPALLVAAGFVLLAAYHAIMPFAMFSKAAYVVAHCAHIGGYASLLLMLWETDKK
jgi:hypothetical protein